MVRHAVRVLLVDEDERLLLFQSRQPETGVVDLALGPEVWHRRHVFTWRGVRYDQRERWFLARVAHFEPDSSGWTDVERADLKAYRWWTVADLDGTTDELVPRDLAARLRALLVDGPPASPIDVGV